MANNVIEIFGKRVRIVKDNGGDCSKCALREICHNLDWFGAPCEDANGGTDRHFELVNDKSK